MEKNIIEMGLQEHQNMEVVVTQGKYVLKDEKTLQDVKDRLSGFMPTPDLQEFIKSDRFIAAGSILSGAGNDEFKCSLSNCYVLPILQDSIEGILECCKQMARTYSYRGGVGVNITILRPKGDRVNNSAKASSGSVSFMPLFSEVTNTIGQSGRR